MRSPARISAMLGLLALIGIPASFPASLAEAAPRSRAECADVMAGFADVAVPKRGALSAEERRSAETIERLFQGDDFTTSATFEELKVALQSAPELLNKDPNSAVRASMIMLLSGDLRSVDLLEKAAGSSVDFAGATLSNSEIGPVADALLAHRPASQNVGFLGLDFRVPLISPENVLDHERRRAALIFRTVAALAASARGTERTKLRQFVDFGRIVRPHPSSWVASEPMRPLLEGMKRVAPYGPEEVQVWVRSFHRMAGSKEPPLAIAHRTPEGGIRITSSDPFEGSKMGTVGHERVFSSAEFQKWASRAGEEGLTLPSADGTAGLRLSKKLLGRLAGRGANASAAPPYESWSKDGRIRGVIWPDYGFPAADAEETMNEYLSFYKGQGFRFRKETVSDFPEWLKKRVSSGEADYLVREAHIQLEMALVEKGTLMIGTSADGAHEVTLLFPENFARAFMNWSELDTALKARAKADSENELLYFDTKCHAFSHACSLPAKIASTNLRVIAADGVAMTMVDQPKSPIRAMLEGILNQEDYNAIGKRLQKARSGVEDNYILPGTARYDQATGRPRLAGGAAEWVNLPEVLSEGQHRTPQGQPAPGADHLP